MKKHFLILLPFIFLVHKQVTSRLVEIDKRKPGQRDLSVMVNDIADILNAFVHSHILFMQMPLHVPIQKSGFFAVVVHNRMKVVDKNGVE